MTTLDVTSDLTTLTLTVAATYAAPAERVWQLWDDPRKLERWWGPPTHPATVVEHELRPGGHVSYYMTAPDGARYRGWWDVVEVDAPKRLLLEDAFCDEEGRPDRDMPVSLMEVRLEELDAGSTKLEITSRYASREAMQQVLDMGAVDGVKAAMSQIDEILAEGGAS